MRPFASQCWRTPGSSTDHKLPSAAQASASKTLSAYHCGSPKQRVTGDGSKVEEGGLALLLMVWQLGQPAYLGKRRDDTVKLTIILIPLRGAACPNHQARQRTSSACVGKPRPIHAFPSGRATMPQLFGSGPGPIFSSPPTCYWTAVASAWRRPGH